MSPTAILDSDLAEPSAGTATWPPLHRVTARVRGAIAVGGDVLLAASAPPTQYMTNDADSHRRFERGTPFDRKLAIDAYPSGTSARICPDARISASETETADPAPSTSPSLARSVATAI